MPNIAIPNDYFKKSGQRDYANWRWSFWRELVQNSVDCGSKNFKITLDKLGTDTLVTFSNDGNVMTEDILVNKLLALGATTKIDAAQTGGFGIAKIVIMLMHKSYEVHTGNLIVKGSGGEYDLTTNNEFFDGTKTTVLIEGDELDDLDVKIRQLINFSQLDCNIEYIKDGVVETHKPQLRKGSPRREFAWGTIYSNKSYSNKVIVRVNGVCMFTTWTGYDDCIIIELTGKSTDLLTSNRDSLNETYRRQYEAFIGEISVNRSALKAPIKTYTRYAGSRHLVSTKQEQLTLSEPITAESLAAFLDKDAELLVQKSMDETLQNLHKPRLGAATLANSNPSQLNIEFIVKNETDLTVPEYLMPHSSKFSKYARTLARYWANVLVEVHKLLDVAGNFAVGFVVSEDCRAQYESGDYGTVYYLNPVSVVKQKGSGSRSFKTRLKLTDKDDIIASAVHEVVHGMGYGSHDESYAVKLTDAFAVILKNRQQLMKCFR